MSTYYKLPRLYVESLNASIIALTKEQSHYLFNVMRLKKGDKFRGFNANDGEYLINLDNKTEAIRHKKISDIWSEKIQIHLYVPPLPKERMHFMIEKATELGVASYTPLITERAQVRKVNKDKIRSWMIEAVEQSERFDIPEIYDPVYLSDALQSAKGEKYAAIERLDVQSVSSLRRQESLDDKMKILDQIQNDTMSVFIGPAGGWADQEIEELNQHCQNINLGTAILRSETAVLKALSLMRGAPMFTDACFG